MINNKIRKTEEVLSTSQEKTIVVGISWAQKDRLYKKSYRKLTRLVAHDELNKAEKGDTVIIEFSKPISKTKKWKLIEVVKK